MTEQENSPAIDSTPNMEDAQTDAAEVPDPNEVQDIEAESTSGVTPEIETNPEPEQPPVTEAGESDVSISASELAEAVQNTSVDTEEKGSGKDEENSGQVEASIPPVVTQVHPAEFQPLFSSTTTHENGPSNIDMLLDVVLKVSVELGRAQLPVREILELQNGAVVELDRIAGDPVDIFVNNRLIAQGEVVVVDDKFGVRISEIFSAE